MHSESFHGNNLRAESNMASFVTHHTRMYRDCIDVACIASLFGLMCTQSTDKVAETCLRQFNLNRLMKV